MIDICSYNYLIDDVSRGYAAETHLIARYVSIIESRQIGGYTGNMKKSITALFLIILIAAGVAADDGSWNKAFSINGGSIYSETEHADITLEKELLIFNGEKTTVFFLFKKNCEFNLRSQHPAFLGF